MQETMQYSGINSQEAELVDEAGRYIGETIICKAYKPTHYSCVTPAGGPASSCLGCPGWSRCEWTFFELQDKGKVTTITHDRSDYIGCF